MSEWTQERIEKLRTLWVDGNGCTAIGAEMGISRSAVIGKVHREGFQFLERNLPLRKPRAVRKPRPRKLPFITRFNWQPELFSEPTNIVVISLDLTFDEIEPGDRRCRFVTTDDAPFLYCGHPAVEGKSWCAAHMHIVYKAPSARGGNTFDKAIDRFEAAKKRHEQFGDGFVEAESA